MSVKNLLKKLFGRKYIDLYKIKQLNEKGCKALF